MPDQPTPVWGLRHPNGEWYPCWLYSDLEEATSDARGLGCVPVKLVPADALEASTARVAELERRVRELQEDVGRLTTAICDMAITDVIDAMNGREEKGA